MNQQAGSYQVIDFPHARREAPNIVDTYLVETPGVRHARSGRYGPATVHADHKACTGEVLSFTGYCSG